MNKNFEIRTVIFNIVNQSKNKLNNLRGFKIGVDLDENNRPVIWGAIVAGLLVILSVAALYFYYQRNANKQPENQKTEEQPLTPPANEEREVPTVPLEDRPKPKQEEQVAPQQKNPVSGPENSIY